MNGRTIGAALDRMRAAFPRQPFGDVAVRVYAEQLADLDDGAVWDAVGRLLNTSVHMPTIAEIRREVVEAELMLPTPEQAWEMALAGSSQGIAEVAAAMKAVGGPWLIRNTSNPETLRAQFLRFYEGKRGTTIRLVAGGPTVTPEQLRRARALPALPPAVVEREPVVSLNGRRVERLPVSTRIRPRPMMTRLAIRLAGRELPPPTDDDVRDAIELLREGPETPHDPKLDSLYREAEYVMLALSEHHR